MSNVTLASPFARPGLAKAAFLPRHLAKVIPRIAYICDSDHWFAWFNLASDLRMVERSNFLIQ